MNTDLIFLIGLPGSGKTTIGKELSKKIGVPFVDTDEIICAQQGKTIEAIFNENGEDYFRKQEKATLENIISRKESSIISTGGGLPCFFDNMDQINRDGISIFLNVSPETIVERLWNQRDANRPMIKGKTKEGLLEFLKGKLQERIPFYSKARIIVSGENITSKEIEKKMYESGFSGLKD